MNLFIKILNLLSAPFLNMLILNKLPQKSFDKKVGLGIFTGLFSTTHLCLSLDNETVFNHNINIINWIVIVVNINSECKTKKNNNQSTIENPKLEYKRLLRNFFSVSMNCSGVFGIFVFIKIFLLKPKINKIFYI
jgi:hypothetical protein